MFDRTSGAVAISKRLIPRRKRIQTSVQLPRLRLPAIRLMAIDLSPDSRLADQIPTKFPIVLREDRLYMRDIAAKQVDQAQVQPAGVQAPPAERYSVIEQPQPDHRAASELRKTPA